MIDIVLGIIRLLGIIYSSDYLSSDYIIVIILSYSSCWPVNTLAVGNIGYTNLVGDLEHDSYVSIYWK